MQDTKTFKAFKRFCQKYMVSDDKATFYDYNNEIYYIAKCDNEGIVCFSEEQRE